MHLKAAEPAAPIAKCPQASHSGRGSSAGTISLLFLTLLVFIPSYKAGFIWDDDVIAANPLLREGWHGLRDIWFSTRFGDFCPVTATTFWLEWQCYGGMKEIQHATNIVLQALNAVLLWRVLKSLRIPGAWLAAAVFAVHPICVASVTWLAERKNTLSMFFYLLSLWLYLSEEQTAGRGPASSNGRQKPFFSPFYIGSIVSFVLGLLSKSSVVVLPVVLLLCEWWRAGRIERSNLRRVLPFFIFAFSAGAVTLVAHFILGPKLGVLPSPDNFLVRSLTGGYAFWFYLSKDLLPIGLTLHYPRWNINPASPLAWGPGAAIVATALVFWRFRGTWGKACLFGFGYFLVAVGPTLGIVNMAFLMMAQVADHLQYLALPGLIALCVGAISSQLPSGTARPFAATALALLLIIPLSILSWRHQALMGNPEALWRDNLKKNPISWAANNNLGGILFERGQYDAAESYYRTALRYRDGLSFLHVNLGRALFALGKTPEAVTQYAQALQIDPKDFNAWNNAGVALLNLGKTNEAVFNFRKAVDIAPGNATFAANLGRLLEKTGRTDEAIQAYRNMVQRSPDDPDVRYQLARLLLQKEQLDEAATHFKETIRLAPDSVNARFDYGELLVKQYKTAQAMEQWREILKLAPDKVEILGNLAWALATSPDAKLRNGAEAVKLAERARTLAPKVVPGILDLLAASYAEAGRFSEALKSEEEAEALASSTGEQELVAKYHERQDLYRHRQPVRSQ